MERQNAKDKAVINDKNTSPFEKTVAEERVAQREKEIGPLTKQIKGMERNKLLEKIKDIFKKHGTLTVIVLAAGVTIGSFIGVIKNALTKTGKALENGLKEIGKKTALLLPGLLGLIASFLFKAAGQAIGFLAEHTWLLILAVVAFPMESYIKKRR